MSRASYSADGLPQWIEGKVADSSRVYLSYDALGRLVRSYRIRPAGDTVRLDSLVYDANGRAFKRVNSLNQATTFTYNSAGGVLSAITPTGDTTNLAYTSQGLLQQARAPGQVGWTVYTYDAAWKNVENVTDAAGVVLATNIYDGYGRRTESRRKLTVQLVDIDDGPDTVQWRRSLTGFDSFNRVDSVRLDRTRNCAAPCNTPPPWWGFQWQSVRHIYDRLGRDTARVNAQGKRTRYAYDGLGRLRMRWPFADSAAVVDSLRYDVAGNLRYQWTRRGYLIEHRYDARGRDTASIVPGIGTYRRTYGGPADQLTRAWIDSYTNAIGGVNPEVRWSYSQGGLLLADTSQGNRGTTYQYDQYGRDTSLTDVLGPWRLRYDAIRAVLDTIVTPFGDTLRWTIDTRARYVGPYVSNGANPDFAIVPSWNNVGKLVGLQNTHSVNVGIWGGDDEMPDLFLRTTWSEQQGSGGPTVSAWDSLVHDGWGRLTAITYRKNGAVLGSTTYDFDLDGNVTPNSESRVFDLSTTRLTQRAGYSYRFDRAGNLDTVTAGSPAWKYVYDAFDRLIEARQGGTLIARYAYDVLGRRIAKRVYAGAGMGYFRMIYRGGEVIADADSNGALTFGYTRGLEADNLVAIRRYSDGSHYYVVHDPLGSVRGLSKRDGTWIASWRYDAYGTVIDSAGSAPFSTRYRWTGREYDAEIGLYFFRARFYDPVAQRFIQEDPIGFAGSANLYAYGDGNPTNGRDPSGLLMRAIMYSPDGLFGPLSMGGGAGGVTAGFGRFAGGGFGDWNGDGIDDHYYFEQVTWLSQRTGMSISELEYAWSIDAVMYTNRKTGQSGFVPQLADVFVTVTPQPEVNANELAKIPLGIQDSRCPGFPGLTCESLLGGIKDLLGHDDPSCKSFGRAASGQLASGRLQYDPAPPYKVQPDGSITITYGYSNMALGLVWLTSAPFAEGNVTEAIAHEETHIVFRTKDDWAAGYFGSLCSNKILP